MKTYIIASTEYHANMPDLFLMTEDGQYFGVSQHSYVRFDNFPKEVNHWVTREGSDADRFFNIDCVDLDEADVARFDQLTQEYAELDKNQPSFEERYPLRADYKSKKAYTLACDDYMTRYRIWLKDNDIAGYVTRKNEIWKERTMLFCSLSQKVYDAIKYNDNIRYA